MAILTPALPLSSAGRPISVMYSNTTTLKREPEKGKVFGDFGHLGWVLRKDVEFLKTGIGKGIRWANETLRIPQVTKTLDDVLWLRALENPRASPEPLPSWPQPFYPELTGVDLFMADLKALEAYAAYFYHLPKIWSMPLPEVYDAQSVSDYFNCRPHIVALRLVEVFSSFATATIRIRTSGIRKLLRPNADENSDGNMSKYNFGIVLKETMLNLGPTFIKVGQTLSTRPDIIGTEMAKALSELHDQIPPFPRTMAIKIIEEELGSPVDSFFSYISEEPIAAASFGQVYCATTTDGLTVAVKVQRPNMLHIVVRDIYILRLGLGLLQRIAKRKSDPRLYADELGKGLVGELDYTLEAANALEFLEAHSSFTFMYAPKVFQRLSHKRVLTMEWIAGESPTDLLSLSSESSVDSFSTRSQSQKIEAKRKLLDLVNKGVEASLIQLLETGLLHADPHPGNLRCTSSGQIGFLDFGLLCRMQRKHQFAMLESIVHIVYGDWGSLICSLVDMDVVKPGTNLRRLTLELEHALGEVEFRDGIPNVKFSKVLGKVLSVAFKNHFSMPPYFTLVFRSLASLEGLAVAVDKNFNTFAAAYPYVVQKLLTENSAETRKILHSVVLNKKKEFRWQRLALFLRVGVSRKGLHQMIAPNADDYVPHGVFDVANLVLRLLPSKDGLVLRRLLMTADGASLIRASLSKEAKVLRQQFCSVIADMLCQWSFDVFGERLRMTRYGSRVTDNREIGSSSQLPSSAIDNYYYIMRDKRLKVIFSNILKSTSKDPILLLRFCCASLVMFVTASALACRRVLVSLSEAYLGPIFFSSKQYAVSA